MASTWKDPADLFDYELEFDPLLVGGETLSTIVSATSTNFETGADTTSTIIAASPAPNIVVNSVVLWLQNGVVGERHVISVVITTNQGRNYTGVLFLDILKE